jgi:hypothetical protein
MGGEFSRGNQPPFAHCHSSIQRQPHHTTANVTTAASIAAVAAITVVTVVVVIVVVGATVGIIIGSSSRSRGACDNGQVRFFGLSSKETHHQAGMGLAVAVMKA